MAVQKFDPETTRMAATAAVTSESKHEVEFTTSTGVILKITPPKTRVVYNLYMQNPEPKPPISVIEEGGKRREEANPSDPDYVQAVADHKTKVFDSYIKIIMLTSVSIVSMPEDLSAFDKDDDWLDEMEAIGLQVKQFKNRSERYLEWFFYRVAPTHEDVFGIQSACEGLTAVTEGGVAAAEETFPNNS